MRKRILSILLCLVMVVGLFPTMAFAADGSGATSGSGTASDPYIVTTFEELKAELEKDTVGLGMQYIKVPSGTNITKVLKLDAYASAIEIYRQKTLIVDGTVTVTGATSGRVVRSLLHINGSGERLDIKGKGSLTFEANANGATNAVVDVENNATVNISGGVTLTGAYNLATYGIAVYNYGGTVNIDNATAVCRVTMNCRATATVSSTRKRSFNATHLTTATKIIAFILMTAFRVRHLTDLASSK